MSFAAWYIACAINSSLCSLISLFILCRWIHFHTTSSTVKNEIITKLSKTFIFCQYTSIISFTLVCLIYASEIYVKIIYYATNHSINKLFNSDVDHQLIYNPKHGWEWHMVVLIFCYLYGRYISYVIIYLRLKQMLHGSIFAYKSQTYKKILLLLVCNGLSLVALIIIVSIKTGQTGIIFLFVFVWILTDMFYFIVLTYMYLSNLNKIKNTYRKFIISTQTVSKKSIKINTDTNNDNQKIPHAHVHKCKMGIVDQIQSESATASNNNSYSDNDIKVDVNVKSSSINISNQQLANKKESYQIMSKIVTIYTRISITIFISSFAMFTASSIFDLLLGFQVIVLHVMMIDCVVNILCLVLYFERERKFYGQIKHCNKCHVAL